MEIGKYSVTGETYINFSQEDKLIWGEIATGFNTLQNSGLGNILVCDNYITGSFDYLSAKWKSSDSRNTPVLTYDYDTLRLNGPYLF